MDWRLNEEMQLLAAAQGDLSELALCSDMSEGLHRVVREALGALGGGPGGYGAISDMQEAVMVAAVRLHHTSRAIMWLVAVGRSSESMPNLRTAIETTAKAVELTEDSTQQKSQAWKERRGKTGRKLFNSFLGDVELAGGLHQLLSEDSHGAFIESRAKIECALEDRGSSWFPGHQPDHDNAELALLSTLMYRMVESVELAFEVETGARAEIEKLLDDAPPV